MTLLVCFFIFQEFFLFFVACHIKIFNLGPEEGSFKKDDQISEVSADSTSEKTDVSIPPPAKKSLLAESVLSLKRHHADLKESTNLDAEYAVNQAELDQADGPDEVNYVN